MAIPEPIRNDEVRELLSTGEAPTRFLYLLDAFFDLCRTRRAGLAGAEPIGLDQIFYWQQVYGSRLRKWEVDVIYRLDSEWRDVNAPQESKPAKPKEKPDHGN